MILAADEEYIQPYESIKRARSQFNLLLYKLIRYGREGPILTCSS